MVVCKAGKGEGGVARADCYDLSGHGRNYSVDAIYTTIQRGR